MLVCADCWEKYSFERYERVARQGQKWDYSNPEDNDIDFPGYKKIYEQIDRKALCVQCIAVAEITTSRKMGMPDPYPVYERTPTILREAKFLYNYLIEKFEFRESIAPKSYIFPEHRAICFRPGTFTRPFTITIYYVAEESRQDEMLKAIDGFLKPTGKDQVKVTFYEAENWVSLITPQGFAIERREEEIILREELLNC